MITNHPDAIEATQDLVRDLNQTVSHSAFDRVTRLLYSTDASIYQMMPVGVVFPRHADEAAAAVEVAARHGVPLLPRGGGSSLAGQAVGHALILDFSRHMRSIVHVDKDAKQVRVQPGMTLGNLNRSLQVHGLQFGPDPASAERATVGGVVGNNSTGAHSIVYGMTSDHVLAVDAVLSDGSRARFDAFNGDSWETRGKRAGLEGAIYRALPSLLEHYAGPIREREPKTFRNVSGYGLHRVLTQKSPNLAALLTGSEGTFAATTELTLNLVDVPAKSRLGLVHFSNVRAALEAVPVMLEARPHAIELLDKMLLDLCRDRVDYRRLLGFVEGDPEIILIVEIIGETDGDLDAGVERLRTTLQRLNHKDPLVIVSDPQGQANVWYVRKVGLGILMSIRGDAKPVPFVEDAAVPVAHLADYITRLFDACYSFGVERVAMYAHASAGCIHVRPVINLKTEDGVRQLREIGEASLGLCLEYGGTISSEHGDGLVRGEFVERMYGSEVAAAFRATKAIFDPENRMNPGKIVDTPRMDDRALLRFGPEYATPYAPEITLFDFSTDGGFARSVEMCNGAGVCRKVDSGAMCPSYMGTLDETHATRGRANALRAAMRGDLGPEGLTSHEVHDVLDLCLSCKTCKAECPSAVDMAKLKAEFLHHYQEVHGVKLRTRVFADIARLNRLGQPFAPLANLALRGPAKWAMTALGVHPKRDLPAFANKPFSARFSENGLTEGKEVVFFVDTFTEHNHPQIGEAAVKVLRAAGFRVTVLKQRACCGRPAISKGLLGQAKDQAQTLVGLLAPYAGRGVPILGVEPSCISAITDDYPSLIPGEATQLVAERTMLVDDFLAELIRADALHLDLEDTPRSILLHGHCHQKAVFSTAGTHAILKLLPNTSVTELDTTCCGMAGSFGYEKEHYDLSINIAELKLAPAVREASAETIIAAPGTSCREQIAHTAGRKAQHPVEILAAALREG